MLHTTLANAKRVRRTEKNNTNFAARRFSGSTILRRRTCDRAQRRLLAASSLCTAANKKLHIFNGEDDAGED